MSVTFIVDEVGWGDSGKGENNDRLELKAGGGEAKRDLLPIIVVRCENLKGLTV